MQNGSISFEHLKPMSQGGKAQPENLLPVCANCNNASGFRFTEMEFTFFLAEILRQSTRYSQISVDAILGNESRYRADVVATRIENNQRRRLLIECKSARFASTGKVSDVISQLRKYQDAYGDCQAVFAIPATIDEGDIRTLRAEGIEVWDLDYLSVNFSEELKGLPPSSLTILLQSRAQRGKSKTKEQLLLESLRNCEPGKRDWSVYQSLIGDILELLFCPPLTKPFSEHSDMSMANRRDFIVPNYAESGFWAFLRKKYMADYLVVDAKNYSRKIKKAEILQVANYLKPQGAGLFGMIFSRHGGDAAGCMHTLREQWLIHQKMIIVFNDADVESMLRAKKDGGVAEDLVGKKIEEFRLSM